ncbi:DUF3883 domain-containing protein [Variovorax sp. NFACC27]|uniref:DUF3883 domain-containing protein n=1 Tax=unclassified Variovorax TaxID=663243 RepID=UPI00089D8CA4|nr:protein of unknown function [Variovorax sp. NFACC28]SEG60315.1 protein of unknown function [Variovorax sp. NFACC29]SFC59811.1 protein of unknown function [Variovorax sp. NFACC26]SFG67269.1 protein of unknown function [Variovorax sp. NFACC27]
MRKNISQTLVAAAAHFNRIYDGLWENGADMQRGEFLERFPIESLRSLTLKEYAIGQNKGQTFCHWAEPGTDKWARIKGATSSKFGIYYGHEGKRPEQRFRYTKKFAGNLSLEGAEALVFPIVRDELTSLVERGRILDFRAVDANRLSQMLKAKILSLYFGDLYLPICSEDILLELARALDIDSKSPSEIQHETLRLKQRLPIFKGWSNLKLTDFLLQQVSGDLTGVAPPQRKAPPPKPKFSNLDFEPNFEELAKKAREKGEKSERFALEREKARLRSRGLGHLIPKILDRTKKPRYGYDFDSFSDADEPRHIEVKTFTRSSFFLSANELRIAQSEGQGKRYFFYLVTYDRDGEPTDCLVYRAVDVLGWCDLLPQNFMVKAPKGFEKGVHR